MRVEKVMHAGVTWVEPDTPVSEIARKMREEDIGAIPVGENDRLIGMVTDRDIVCRALANGADSAALTARDVMSAGIAYCHSDDELDAAIDEMSSKHIRRLPVLNKSKRMVGILAMGDISDAADSTHCTEFMQGVSSHHG
jgi:CBS domain-containing protein